MFWHYDNDAAKTLEFPGKGVIDLIKFPVEMYPVGKTKLWRTIIAAKELEKCV